MSVEILINLQPLFQRGFFIDLQNEVSVLNDGKQLTNQTFLDALGERVLIFDGAMGTNLQAMNLSAEHFGGEQYIGCNDYLVITHPQAVEAVHRSFLDVGVDVIQTNTFRSNRITLTEYGLQDLTNEINRQAAEMARQLADEYTSPHQPRFVAGSMGPTGKLPSANDPQLSNITFDELVEIYHEQAVGLIQGGADLLLIETSQDILEVKAAIHGIRKAHQETGEYLPIQVQVTLDTTGRMLLGTDIQATTAILDGLPIDVIGLNCSTGPEHMRQPIEYLGEHTSLPVSCIPNAGLPLNVDGEPVYPLEPRDFAAELTEFVEKHNISIVGGCCGTTPDHLRSLVENLHGRKRPARPNKRPALLASGIQAIALSQDPPPFLIGERCNAQGSRRFKRMLLNDDHDAIITLARKQVDNGAHALDVSVAVTERANETELMRSVVHDLVTAGIDVPLVIDTTELDVMEAALKAAPGRCLLNSTHLEAGRDKADQVFSLAKAHNAAVLMLTIDENGMARTVEDKLAIAERLYEIAINDHGLTPSDLVFDALTFTLATGDDEFIDSAVATIEGIRAIKSALPGVFTSLGISNVSFGLNTISRPVLNTVFLYHCVKAGLDMAIINPAHVTPYAEIPEVERQLAEDLIFNRRSDALQRFIEFFESLDHVEITTSPDPTEGMSAAERIHWRIVGRYKEGIEADIDEIIRNRIDAGESESESQDEITPTQHTVAVQVLNEVLLPAMKEVGDRFGAGELILPFVLGSAEVMKQAVSRLETYLERKEGVSKGTIVLATVYGDVHDIGKNLVKTILSNNGYRVVDLGKQVPAETIISTAITERADAIGLSALLVSTSKQMPLIINELHRRGLDFPVLIGGAAINRRFGRRILITDPGEPYQSGVFYCRDAFEGLETMDALINEETRTSLITKVRQESEREMEKFPKFRQEQFTQRSKHIHPAENIPSPTQWGVRVINHMPLEIVFKSIAKNELFRLSWGAKNTHGEEWTRLKAEFEERLAQMQRAALQENWLKPQGMYGYWPAQSKNNDLIVYDPDTLESQSPLEIMRFSFVRQDSGERLCLADYFASVESRIMDVVAFQVVTVGKEASALVDRMQAADDYSEAYFYHGLAVQTAEAAAEYLHQHIRNELGLVVGQGKRYSWGYPAVPDLQGHRKVFDLLPVEKELGMSLTSAFQLIPEQSTAAIIIHHPGAKYFSVGTSRVEQLMQAKG